MYWIYLAIFTLIVFVPSVVHQGVFVFDEVQLQEFSILALGIVFFILYTIQERRQKRSEEEKCAMTTQVSRMKKDLTQSYSYIGEINRKLDILEHIALGFPETSQLVTGKKEEVYGSIMAAVRLFSKSEKFVLRFVSSSENAVLKEIRSVKHLPSSLLRKGCPSKGQFFETEELIATASPKAIDNAYACIIVKKKNPSHTIDDPEIMKTIAMQALLLFMFIQQRNGQKKDDLNNTTDAV